MAGEGAPFKVFRCPPGLRITLEGSVEARCPFTGAPDFYELSIEYISGGLCVEAVSFSGWLDSFRGREISQEDLTAELINTIKRVLEPRSLCVRLTGDHGRVTITTEACGGDEILPQPL